MKTSSCLGGRIQAYKMLILAIWVVFGNLFGSEKSGRFMGVSGIEFQETGADSGLDLV